MSICSAAGNFNGLPVEPKPFPMRLLLLATGLLASCCPSPPPPYTPVQPKGKVVLVHGFLETGSAFSPMKKRLESQGFECLVPKLRPSDGRGGLEHLARGLKQDIDRAFGEDDPIQMVAFSMGGLVSREYLQNLGGAKRCTTLITVASPHHGTQAAWLYPSKGAVQMRPNSGFLQQLRNTESRLGDMTVVSYRTRLDLVILPSTNSIWDRAENIEHPALLHPLLLNAPTVLQDIEQRLATSGKHRNKHQ